MNRTKLLKIAIFAIICFVSLIAFEAFISAEGLKSSVAERNFEILSIESGTVVQTDPMLRKKNVEAFLANLREETSKKRASYESAGEKGQGQGGGGSMDGDNPAGGENPPGGYLGGFDPNGNDALAGSTGEEPNSWSMGGGNGADPGGSFDPGMVGGGEDGGVSGGGGGTVITREVGGGVTEPEGEVGGSDERDSGDEEEDSGGRR